jgi:hypothetical protein
MSITYSVTDFADTDTQAEVVYTNDQGFTHTRMINLPRDSSGALIQDEYDEILEGQLRGVTNKASLNVITFIDPNAEITE